MEATRLFSLVMFENVRNNDCFEKKQHLIVSTLDKHCIAHPGSWPGFCPSDPGRKKCWSGIAKPWVFSSSSSHHHCLASTASKAQPPQVPSPRNNNAGSRGGAHPARPPSLVTRSGRRGRPHSPGRSLSAQVARGRRLPFEPRPLDSASYFMTPTCRMGRSGPWACRGYIPCRTYCTRATASPCTAISTNITTTSSMTSL